MGKGGVSPDYFLHRMQMWEVQLFMDGLNMRDHTQWEATRFMTHSVACMFCKDVNKDEKSWMPFPWERDAEDEYEDDPTEVTEDYIREMQEMIRQENEQIQHQQTDQGDHIS